MRWLNENSQLFLERGYLSKGQTVQERFKIIAHAAERELNLPGFAQKLTSYFEKGWFSLSTPIWTNFGNDRGLPISCFGSYMDDSMESILATQAEIGMMTKVGGGTSAYYGNLRHRGAPIKDNGHSSGAVHFMNLAETQVNVISQGSARRGSFAAYLDIDHPDILEFLKIQSEGFYLQKIHFGVIVPDKWLEEMIAGDEEKRIVWAAVLKARSEVGEPYIIFYDNVNRGTVDVYKDKGMIVRASNLCTEIFLPSNTLESFVCDLCSANILYYDEWKDTDLIEVLVYFLDAVMSEFIRKAADIPFMERAVRFAGRHRALGIGWIGWHSYLQSHMIPFDSFEAKQLNVKIAKNMYEAGYKASAKMAAEYGEPEVLVGYGRRHTTLFAIAPTKSSSFILGQVSQGIEPFNDNYYIEDLAKGKYTVKNTQLEKVLIGKGKNTDEIWMSILKAGGSVQHLEFLTEHEKAVFKTFSEISPKEIIIQAAQRQKYIDQGQSLNLLIHPDTPPKDINALILEAWRLGIKSLYYQYNLNAAQQFYKGSILACTSCEA